MSFLLTSVTFACDICKAPQRSAGDDAGESVLELSLDSLESVVEVHSLVVLLLFDDRTAARQRLQSFARAAAALKELETGDELETGESVVLGRIDVASYAEVAHRLEVCRMPSRTPHASCRMQFCTPHAACRTRAAPNRRCLPAPNLIRRHRLCRAQVPRSALPAVRLLRGDAGTLDYFSRHLQTEAVFNRGLKMRKEVKPDRLQVVCEGKAGRLKSFVRWCHNGPPMSRADSVEVEWKRASK